jgi:hypothetical protein
MEKSSRYVSRTWYCTLPLCTCKTMWLKG